MRFLALLTRRAAGFSVVLRDLDTEEEWVDYVDTLNPKEAVINMARACSCMASVEVEQMSDPVGRKILAIGSVGL